MDRARRQSRHPRQVGQPRQTAGLRPSPDSRGTLVVLGSTALARWMIRSSSQSAERLAIMRATIMHKAHDVRVETIPDAAIQEPTDAVIRITRACICGSDLWP